MRTSLKHFWILALLSCAASLFANGVSVEFDKDRIEMGKEFRLSVVIAQKSMPAQHGVPSIGELKGFTLNKVDSVDERVNGFFTGPVMVRKYRFYMVAPNSAGSFNLPLMWEFDGSEHNIGNVPIVVARAYDASALLVSLTPSKRTVYEGEQFSLTMNLQTFENFQGGLGLSGIDLGNDFVAHRSDLANLQMTRSQKNGVQMEATAKVAWVSAIRPGTLTIPELKFKYQKMSAPKVVNKQMGNFSYSSVTQQPEEATASSGSIQIQALALPSEGRPASFAGMVGQYTFKVTPDRTSLQVGEALTLLIQIRGNGKPGSISDPVLPDFSEFRSVPPESQVTKIEKDGMIWTERTLKIFLYPKKKGDFSIPAIRFSWFDPARKRYEEAVSPQIQIKVAKGDITQAAASGGQSFTPTAPTAEKKDIEALGSDIRYIHEAVEYPNEAQNLHRKVWFYLLLLLPFALALLGIRLDSKRRNLLHDVAYQRRHKAQVVWNKAWAEVEAALQAQDTRRMLAVLEPALLTFIGDLCNQDLGGLTRDALRAKLQKCALPVTAIDALLDFLRECDQARFSPAGASAAESTRILGIAQQIAADVGRAKA